MGKILIAEDNPDIRHIIGLLLAQRGHETLEAEDGMRAVELAAEQRPDLIIMDLGMPVLSGWDATRQIKSNPETADIPVIALTAHAMKGDRERAWEAGCDGFIVKPIDDELLLHTADQVLSERQTKKAKGAAKELIVAAAGSAQSKIFSIHNEHVLIVDDQEDLAELMASKLKAQGYRISVVQDAQKALAMVETDPPDLIICDVRLPDLSGYEITGRIKQNAQLPFIPIILVTAGTVDRKKGLEAGADDFIAKPIDLTELVVRVRSLVRLKQAITSEANRANELASIISQLATGILIVDAEGTITIISGRGLEIMGVPLDDVLGASVDDLIARLGITTPEGAPLDPANFPPKRALAKGETVTKQLIGIRSGDGKRILLRCNAAPIYNEHGQRIGAVGLFEDVTEDVSTRSAP